MAAELDGAGNLIKQFVYADGVNSPDYMIAHGKKFLFSKDHRGSITMVVDSVSGEMKQKIKYSDWGEVLEDTNPGFIPFGYAGGMYDQDTKLIRFGARSYDPLNGRWTNKDPIRFSGGDSNLYGYVQQEPINNFDPFGLETWGIGGAFSLTIFTHTITGSLEYVWDDKGGRGYTSSIMYGPGGSFGLSSAITGGVTYTNANSIHNLGGAGGQSGIGAFAGFGGQNSVVYGNGYQGYNSSLGYGAGIAYTTQIGYTELHIINEPSFSQPTEPGLESRNEVCGQ